MSATQHLEAARSTQTNQKCCPVIDLRQYTLYPGTRDEFIELYDRELVETQEACGMRIIGQFRDLGDPNRFVWMRGFPDMPSREKALNAFYFHGEAWKAHGEAARSKMIDSSDALLLRPAWPDSGFSLEPPDRRPALQSDIPQGIIAATIYYFAEPVSADFLGFFKNVIAPVLTEAGARFLGFFATEHSPNNFPRLPLREGENVFVTFSGFRELEAYDRFMTALGRDPQWRMEIYPGLLRQLQTRPQVLRLQPTSRSLLRP